MVSEIVLPSPALPTPALARTQVGYAIPAIVAGAGERASRRFLEFFAATIRNPNTRAAYYRAIVRFFAWCEAHGLDELALIEPLHVAAYVEQLGHDFEKPTVKQHLAAVRMLFDWLVTGGVLAVNPAAPVRGPKHVVKRGRTPVLTADEARQLLDSIDVSTVIGLRDRALIALMTYTFARISASVAMRVEDYYPEGKRWWVRLHEKGGKEHAMPAHHNLEAWMDAYLHAAGFADQRKTPCDRSFNPPRLWPPKSPQSASFCPWALPRGRKTRRRRCCGPVRRGAARWSRLGN